MKKKCKCKHSWEVHPTKKIYDKNHTKYLEVTIMCHTCNYKLLTFFANEGSIHWAWCKE